MFTWIWNKLTKPYIPQIGEKMKQPYCFVVRVRRYSRLSLKKAIKIHGKLCKYSFDEERDPFEPDGVRKTYRWEFCVPNNQKDSFKKVVKSYDKYLNIEYESCDSDVKRQLLFSVKYPYGKCWRCNNPYEPTGECYTCSPPTKPKTLQEIADEVNDWELQENSDIEEESDE